MADDRCRDCARPIRMATLASWNGARFPIDYTPTPEGVYAVLGPDDAVYVKPEERSKFFGALYTDHRRTCPKRSADAADPNRPLFPDIAIVCHKCQGDRTIVDLESVVQVAQQFANEHAECRRKAS